MLNVTPENKKTTILEDIVAHKKQELLKTSAAERLEQLKQEIVVLQPAGRFKTALAERLPTSPKLILEVKPKSPSGGNLNMLDDLETLIKIYSRFGAGISVLTDAHYFGGSLDLLGSIRQLTPIPLLRKDFILEPIQIYEARQAGADAVLLIVKILDDITLFSLTELTLTLGMTPVVEIQNQQELERIQTLSTETVILINNRNLDTFEISFETTKTLAPQLNERFVTISASGIQTREDLEALLPYCQCFLIGSSLMKTSLCALQEKLEALLGT
jgi:indole-3-glycerol phosphate synthase